jgi:hypothetical protein
VVCHFRRRLAHLDSGFTAAPLRYLQFDVGHHGGLEAG